jgi:hypothetical protein
MKIFSFGRAIAAESCGDATKRRGRTKEEKKNTLRDACDAGTSAAFTLCPMIDVWSPTRPLLQSQPRRLDVPGEIHEEPTAYIWDGGLLWEQAVARRRDPETPNEEDASLCASLAGQDERNFRVEFVSSPAKIMNGHHGPTSQPPQTAKGEAKMGQMGGQSAFDILPKEASVHQREQEKPSGSNSEG